MKFIIANATALEFDVLVRSVVLAIEPDHDLDHLASHSVFALDDTHVHSSVTRQGDDIVVEMDDEGLLMVIQAYLKVAKLIAPFVKPFITMMSVFKDERSKLDAFFSKRK